MSINNPKTDRTLSITDSDSQAERIEAIRERHEFLEMEGHTVASVNERIHKDRGELLAMLTEQMQLNETLGHEIKDAHQTIFEYEEEKDIDGEALKKAESKLEAVRELLRDETLPAYWRRQIKQAIMEDK